MDLHIYRNSQDRWHDLKASARERGAVLAINAFTLDELVERITPGMETASPGQRFVLVGQIIAGRSPGDAGFAGRYVYDALGEIKGVGVRPSELRSAGAELLAEALEKYDEELRTAGLLDPQDRRALAASRIADGAVTWLSRFTRVVLHALYDLTETEFLLVRALIENLPEGGVVVLFNTTTNVRATQFAEWTWRRFIQDESLAEKTFPEFCRASNPTRAVLDRLFDFESRDPLPADPSLRILEAPGRYKEIECIGGEVSDLLSSGESPNEIAVVVRHIESYGEMLEDVFSRYGIPHSFETGVPLVRVPFIKYWLALLDLATNDRSREALGRVMSSAYYRPRLSPQIDVERTLAELGYIDRHHLRASALAQRKQSSLAVEFNRLELWLDELEQSSGTVAELLRRARTLEANPARSDDVALTERDRQAWRTLVDELEAIQAVLKTMGFIEFRKIASEIAGLRTVNRLSGAVIAPGLPRVRILGPQSLGLRDYRWIFAPGFTDGEFPARSFSNPLLTDDVINSVNARVKPRRILTARDRHRREPLYLFMILDSATRRVTLTYPGSTLEGERIYPSVYVGEIARHYEQSPVLKFSSGVPRAEGERRSAIADAWRAGLFTDDRALELLGGDIVTRSERERKGIARADLGRGFLPIDGIWNPSELNALSACGFVFLARHRLGLRPSVIPDFEVPPFEIGILAHTILRDFYSRPVPSAIEEARDRMDKIVAKRLSAADINGQGAYCVFDPALWKIRRRQLVSVLHEYVKFAVRDAQDGFVTQPEYLDVALPSARLGEILLSGRPDHVAAHLANGKIDAIRIDDFKYSAASSFTMKQLKQSFQIPVYAYLAAQALGAQPDVRIDGRYLLLRSPSNPVVSHPIDELVFADVRTRIDELLEKVREGKLHPDPAEKKDCDECDYRRLCRLYGG